MASVFGGFSQTYVQLDLPCFILDSLAYNKQFFGREDVIGKPDQVLLPKRKILDDYIDMEGPGSILVTSKNPLVKDYYEDMAAIGLPPFGEDDSLKFLKQLSGPSIGKKEAQDAREIAQQLGGLPLGLSQIAGIITEQFVSFSVLRERLTGQADREGIFGSSVTEKGDLSSI